MSKGVPTLRYVQNSVPSRWKEAIPSVLRCSTYGTKTPWYGPLELSYWITSHQDLDTQNPLLRFLLRDLLPKLNNYVYLRTHACIIRLGGIPEIDKFLHDEPTTIQEATDAVSRPGFHLFATAFTSLVILDRLVQFTGILLVVAEDEQPAYNVIADPSRSHWRDSIDLKASVPFIIPDDLDSKHHGVPVAYVKARQMMFDGQRDWRACIERFTKDTRKLRLSQENGDAETMDGDSQNTRSETESSNPLKSLLVSSQGLTSRHKMAVLKKNIIYAATALSSIQALEDLDGLEEINWHDYSKKKTGIQEGSSTPNHEFIKALVGLFVNGIGALTKRTLGWANSTSPSIAHFMLTLQETNCHFELGQMQIQYDTIHLICEVAMSGFSIFPERMDSLVPQWERIAKLDPTSPPLSQTPSPRDHDGLRARQTLFRESMQETVRNLTSFNDEAYHLIGPIVTESLKVAFQTIGTGEVDGESLELDRESVELDKDTTNRPTSSQSTQSSTGWILPDPLSLPATPTRSVGLPSSSATLHSLSPIQQLRSYGSLVARGSTTDSDSTSEIDFTRSPIRQKTKPRRHKRQRLEDVILDSLSLSSQSIIHDIRLIPPTANGTSNAIIYIPHDSKHHALQLTQKAKPNPGCWLPQCFEIDAQNSTNPVLGETKELKNINTVATDFIFKHDVKKLVISNGVVEQESLCVSLPWEYGGKRYTDLVRINEMIHEAIGGSASETIPTSSDQDLSIFSQDEWKYKSTYDRADELFRKSILVLRDVEKEHPNPHPDFGEWDLVKIQAYADVFSKRTIENLSFLGASDFAPDHNLRMGVQDAELIHSRLSRLTPGFEEIRSLRSPVRVSPTPSGSTTEGSIMDFVEYMKSPIEEGLTKGVIAMNYIPLCGEVLSGSNLELHTNLGSNSFMSDNTFMKRTRTYGSWHMNLRRTGAVTELMTPSGGRALQIRQVHGSSCVIISTSPTVDSHYYTEAMDHITEAELVEDFQQVRVDGRESSNNFGERLDKFSLSFTFGVAHRRLQTRLIILDPGSDLIIKPNTFFILLALDDSITIERSIFVTSCLRHTLSGLTVHAFMGHHLSSSFVERADLVYCFDLLLYYDALALGCEDHIELRAPLTFMRSSELASLAVIIANLHKLTPTVRLHSDEDTTTEFHQLYMRIREEILPRVLVNYWSQNLDSQLKEENTRFSKMFDALSKMRLSTDGYSEARRDYLRCITDDIRKARHEEES